MSIKKTLLKREPDNISPFEVIVAWFVLFLFLGCVAVAVEYVVNRSEDQDESRFPWFVVKVENRTFAQYAGSHCGVATFLANGDELREGDSARLVVQTEERAATIDGKVVARVDLCDGVYAIIESSADDVRRFIEGGKNDHDATVYNR